MKVRDNRSNKIIELSQSDYLILAQANPSWYTPVIDAPNISQTKINDNGDLEFIEEDRPKQKKTKK